MTAATLDTPLLLPCGTTIPNRIGKSATQEGLATPLGHASELNRTLYRRWSEGGAGLLISGDVMVDYSHRERPGNIVIDNNGGMAELRAWAEAGQVAGNQLWMQINQPGRQTPIDVQKHPLGPSANMEGLPPEGFGMPRAMTGSQIEDLIRRFGVVAAIARETGFSGVQLHAAHGFMASSFLSPLCNTRTDEWGGSLENRARFLIESLRAIRRAVGADFPVSVKMNSADFHKGGFDMDQSMAVIEMLNAENLDLLEVSGGNYNAPAMIGAIGENQPLARKKAERTLRREAYFMDYARRVRPVAKMPLMITGGFRTRDNMDEALAENATDVIGLARPFCASTDFPARLLRGEITQVPMIEETMLLDRAAYVGKLDDREFNLMESNFQLAWMYVQLTNLGKGEDIDWGLSLEDAPGAFEDLERNREMARREARGELQPAG
ncbi:NADH:flavin oxidoreductase/NADH oxidase family protein [Novosphingobium colocasiae]|uniref:NADH:flavin oxidoreductase/NADH oxidase family protein n=1 Tax=Novosphingobium colocasiae TaxID=1256513 RepID=UPI0035B07686